LAWTTIAAGTVVGVVAATAVTDVTPTAKAIVATPAAALVKPDRCWDRRLFCGEINVVRPS
jgi:hypothetical protein